MKHKFIVLTIIVTLVTTLLTGCTNDTSPKIVDDKVNVVTSFYPLYFLASEIGGDTVNVINLVQAGIEPHDWTPKSSDLVLTEQAQLFLYQGAGLESWLADFTQGLSGAKQLQQVAVSKGIPLIETNGQVDPHTWVSPKSMVLMAQTVYESLVKAAPAQQATLAKNYAALDQKLRELDQQFTTQLAQVNSKNIVVSHEAFAYLARDYGLHQVAIMGLTPDAEPKAQDLLEVAQFVKKHNVSTIFFEELITDELAVTIANETGARTAVLNPLEGLTTEQEKQGDNYISLMQRNLQHLVEGLK